MALPGDACAHICFVGLDEPTGSGCGKGIVAANNLIRAPCQLVMLLMSFVCLPNPLLLPLQQR